MKTVYRIENSLGQGPYNGYDWQVQDKDNTVVRNDLSSAHNDSLHPAPCEDYTSSGDSIQFAATRTKKYKCGFISTNQLHKWFSHYWLRILEQAGFTLQQYEVPDENVVIGKYQVLFIKP
jgi:hypothetical protein